MKNFPRIAAARRLIASCRPRFQMMSGVSAPLGAANGVNNNGRAREGDRDRGRVAGKAGGGGAGAGRRKSGGRESQSRESPRPLAHSVKGAANPAARTGAAHRSRVLPGSFRN